jgi:hypothetical protein
MTDDERQQALEQLSGTWPEHCPQRAFVEGAKWWHWEQTSSTLFPSEVDLAEEKAVAMFGVPATKSADEILAELRKLSARWKAAAAKEHRNFYGEDAAGVWLVECAERLDALVERASAQ